MTISFRCNGCNDVFSVPDVMAGAQATCNKCGAVLQVPASGTVEQAAPQASNSSAGQALQSSSQQANVAATTPNAAASPLQSLTPQLGAGGNPLLDPNYQGPPAGSGPQAGGSSGLMFGTLGGVAAVLALLVLIVLMTGDAPRRAMAGGPSTTSDPDSNAAGNSGEDAGSVGETKDGSSEPATSGSSAANNSNPFKTTGSGSAAGTSTPDSAAGNSGTDNANGGSKGAGASGGATDATQSKPPETPPGDNLPPATPAAKKNDGPVIPDIVADMAAKGRIPKDVIERAFGKGAADNIAKNDNAAAAASGGPTEGAWKAQPDPPLLPLEYKPGRLSVAMPDRADITFPRADSNFVVAHLSSFGKHAVQAIDLREGKFVGKPVTDELPYGSHIEASADGKHIAVKKKAGSSSYGVWSLETGQLLNDFSFSREQDVDAVHFGAADRLVFVNEPFSSEPLKIKVGSVGDGGSLGDFSLPGDRDNPFIKNSFTVSQGGAYAAVVQGQSLKVIDLENGELLGQTFIATKPKECVGMAFSPDGKELAGLFNFASGSHLIIWDMSSGRPMVDAEYDQQLSAFFTSSKRPVLAWAPDKSSIMMGREYIMDVETGKKIWQLPEASRNPVKMIRPFELIVVVRDSSNRKQTLSSTKLPRREIDKIVAEVRSGGSRIDAGLPTLTTADLFSAVPKSHPSSAPNWSVQPDALEGGKNVKMDRTTLLATNGTEVQRVQLAGNSGKLVMLRKAADKLWLETFDLVRGKRANQSQIPAIMDLADASTDGSRALVGVKAERIVSSGIFNSTEKGFDRLDVVSTSKQHICAWRPYAGEKELDDQIVQWVRFVDNDHVATINNRGKLILWQLPECKAKYIFKDFGVPLAISNGRKYVLSGQNDSLRVFELLTGDCVGELQTPPNGVKAARAAFRQDGNELAAIIDAGRDKTLARWSMSDGQLSHNFPLHSQIFDRSFSFNQQQGLDYRGDDYLMVDNRYLVNLERRAVIWRYNLKYGRHLPSSPDGRHWYCAPYDTSSGAWHVNALTIPGATVTGASEFNSLEDQLALYPGMKVGVYVQLGTAVGKLTAEQIRKGISDRLTANGFTVDQQNPQVLLSLSTTQGSTGEQLSVNNGPAFGRFGQPAAPGSTFNQEKVTCKLSLMDSARKVLWEESRVVLMRGIGAVTQGNAQSELRAEMLRSVEGLLANGNIIDVTMPRYVFKDMVKALSGESDMTLKGEGQRVSPEERKKAEDEARKRAAQQPARSGPGGGFNTPGRSGIPGRPGGFPGIPGRSGGFPGRPGGFPGRPGGFPSIPGRGGF